MTDHRTGKWAQAILAAQRTDGTWGAYFHCMAQPTSAPLTTEQALRRLHALGFTIDDEPIRRCVDTMAACLRGERKIDAYWEKGIDWAMYEPLMLAAWIRRFDPMQPDALAYARRWATVAEAGFASGVLDESAWNAACEAEFQRRAHHPRPVMFTAFYHGMLLPGVLSPETSSALVQHVLANGMYYVHARPLANPPALFVSKETSYWLAALEILAEYPCRELLTLAEAHLCLNIGADGLWDLGPKARDSVYFPLSDSWRTTDMRKSDCTERICKLLNKLKQGEIICSGN